MLNSSGCVMTEQHTILTVFSFKFFWLSKRYLEISPCVLVTLTEGVCRMGGSYPAPSPLGHVILSPLWSLNFFVYKEYLVGRPTMIHHRPPIHGVVLRIRECDSSRIQPRKKVEQSRASWTVAESRPSRLSSWRGTVPLCCC